MDERERDEIRREMERARAAAGEQQASQTPQGFQLNGRSSIAHVIGVISGKGGVGKSLVTGILATELSRAGKRVAVLDADITGPSIPKMFGLSGQRATAADDLIVPAETSGGIRIMSTNLLLEQETDPVLWRGPILMGALRQFYEQTLWGELDYLLVDMPPGTGDVALTVFQSLPVEGVLIVATPQDLVQMVVGKAVNMAAMMEVPVLGLVENMGWLVCPHCGERIEPFGASHLGMTADTYGIPVLGRLPIDPALAALCDAGTLERELPASLLADVVDLLCAATHGQAGER